MRFLGRFSLAGWTYLFPASLKSPYQLACRQQRGFASRTLCRLAAEQGGSNDSNEDSINATSFVRANNDEHKWIESYLAKNGKKSYKPTIDAPETSSSSRFATLSKSDLYDAADLQNILQLHTELADALAAEQKPPVDENVLDWNPLLHDQILEILQSDIKNGQDRNNQEPVSTKSSSSPPSPNTDSTTTATTANNKPWLEEKYRSTISQIRAIASDVDGTILTSQQTIHPRTRRAILDAVQRCRDEQYSLQCFFLATGKSQKGALDSLGVELATQLSLLPGVYLQGLYCVDGQGNVVFEQKLTPAATQAAEQLANQWNVSLIAYDGDNLYTTQWTPVVLELNTRYGEPRAQLLDTLAGHAPGFHKILILDHDVNKINTLVRPQLEALQDEFDATVTQAIPTMLEWLPAGCSKGLGVRKLCETLGIDPNTQLLAIGDAENDLSMLQMAAIGVAVGNASPVAQDAADFVLQETNDQGGAGVAIELFAFGNALQ